MSLLQIKVLYVNVVVVVILYAAESLNVQVIFHSFQLLLYLNSLLIFGRQLDNMIRILSLVNVIDI